MFDYYYFKNYTLIAFDLSRQKKFGADPDDVSADSAKYMFVSMIFEWIKENYGKQIMKKQELKSQIIN